MAANRRQTLNKPERTFVSAAFPEKFLRKPPKQSLRLFRCVMTEVYVQNTALLLNARQASCYGRKRSGYKVVAKAQECPLLLEGGHRLWGGPVDSAHL